MREGFAIAEERVGGRVVLAVRGEIDMATAPDLSEAIAAAAGCDELWVDLSGVGFMDSSGISALAAANLAQLRAERGFAVICPPGPVRRVLELSGMDQFLALFPDRAAALSRGA